MKRGKIKEKSRLKNIVLTVLAIFVIIFFIIPLFFSLFNGEKLGNVAVIPVEGVITGDGVSSTLGKSSISSKDIVSFIKSADENKMIEAIIIEINSPGGSAVASDEIATAIKKVNKPIISLIREAGASGGYWIASSTDYIITNRMSITGSIGVVSSYLEFSGLMEEYGVGYERMVTGKYKDIGTPFKKLSEEEEQILQKKMDRIHSFFVKEIAINRNLSESKVRELATGEFFLGVEALEFGLVDQLGGKDDAEMYLKEKYSLEEVDYVTYQRSKGFFDLLSGVMTDFSINM